MIPLKVPNCQLSGNIYSVRMSVKKLEIKTVLKVHFAKMQGYRKSFFIAKYFTKKEKWKWLTKDKFTLFQFLKKTPRQVLSLDVSIFPSYDTSRLQQILQEKQVELPKVAKQGLSTIIADPDVDSSGALNVQSKFWRCI